MIRFALPLLAVAAMASPAMAADVQIQAQGPVVELSVSEVVKARPDIANVGSGVSTLAPTAVAAMQQNAKAMDAVIARIKALGIAKDDIQTAGINLSAQYDYDQAARKQVFRGYQASNTVNVTLRDVAKVGQVLDALVAAGATDINGPVLAIDDETTAKAQARKAAMERARTQALEYAKLAGYADIRLLDISESINIGRPMMLEKAVAADAIMNTSTPVEPGLVGTGVNVTVTYEMVR
ncbi:hypothetical protein NT2_01_03840 [Caenibius tardaugens NBRC 16725]|uniref:SIMPL domain-containing protein n=1 Tax=Caenibius tardaugens NBRC 16725 TaxID=1219035 RepID=U2ZYK9_9SPHN|nr:SIMPL domain-containing protein [Caenibius tardaugens]AZI37147.1 DUF541 domain-containing protein [Caenibius tardaugens NBRC 16725]GAD47613.1 hypothetical protein NT2_01_03840 [Caenibius tardaugens NBRC 16725]